MKVKTRLILSSLPLLINILNARRLGRKIVKTADEPTTKYPIVWRNKYLVKKMKRFSRWTALDLHVHGYSNIPKGNVILAPNHTSGFDPVIMILALENQAKESDAQSFMPVFLGKQELANLWWTKGFAQINNTFFLDREQPRAALEVIDAMVEHAKSERKVMVIFPEGTRSEDGAIGEFKGGAFYAAKKHFLTVVPVTINNAIGLSDLSRSRKPKHRVDVTFHKPIKPMQFMMMDTTAIAKMVQNAVASSLKPPTRGRGKAEKQFIK